MVVKCHGHNPTLTMAIEIGSGDLYISFLS